MHRIKTYRKTAAWTSQGNDFMQTLSRYYSNTFSDAEKQQSINVFLGYFIPRENSKGLNRMCQLTAAECTYNQMDPFNFSENIPIWDLPTDYYMHNIQDSPETEEQSLKPLTQWVSQFILKHLPYSTSDSNKIVDELIRVHSRDLELIDFYSNYHIPYKWTTFEENIAFQISLMARCFTPTFRTNFSPFEPATRRREGRGILKNPSLTGQSSTGSNSSSTSSMDEDSSSDDDSILENTSQHLANQDEKESSKVISFQTMFPPMREIYRTDLKPPDKGDMARYKKYAKIGKILMSNVAMSNYNPEKPWLNAHKRSIALLPLGCYEENFLRHYNMPRVDTKSVRIYERYAELPDTVYNQSPSIADLNTITKYFSCDYKL